MKWNDDDIDVDENEEPEKKGGFDEIDVKPKNIFFIKFQVFKKKIFMIRLLAVYT